MGEKMYKPIKLAVHGWERISYEKIVTVVLELNRIYNLDKYDNS